jgi:hypothetical protein
VSRAEGHDLLVEPYNKQKRGIVAKVENEGAACVYSAVSSNNPVGVYDDL